MYIVSIVPITKIPLPAPQALDYFSSEKVISGGLIEVSIGTRKVFAIVLSCSRVFEQKLRIKKSGFRIKPITGIISNKRIVRKKYLNLAVWASSYFYSPLGLAMKLFIPNILSRPTKKILKEIGNISDFKSNTPPLHPAPHPRPAVAKAMAGKQDYGGQGITSKGFAPVLYHAHHNEKAKIKFYSDEIEKAVKDNRSVLFLVPEIYKIEYFLKKIPELKNSEIAHSGLTPLDQYKIWKKARRGEIKILLGVRSALAIPMLNLGVIIIDEEESPLYKSFDQQPYINAKSVALKLANLTGAKIIIASDFPSFESLWKASCKKYARLDAPLWNILSRSEDIHIIDMREELKAGNYSIFSRKLQEELRIISESNKQAILFINRKGHSSGLLCRDCGHIEKCPNCDVPFVFHVLGFPPSPKASEGQSKLQASVVRLICHHCGKRQKPPSVCPECASYRIKFIGSGTERVEQELTKLLGGRSNRISRLDTDIAPVFDLQKKILDDFREKKTNILIGTQLMLKAELLPEYIDFSGIITLDPMLSLPDFRMHERILGIMDKIKRVSKKIILQTYIPENLTIRSVSLPDSSVIDTELKGRAELSLPPFSQIIKLTYAHKDPNKAEQDANVLKNKLQVQAKNLQLTTYNLQLLGPAPAFIARINNRYIWQIMIKSKIKDLALRNKFLRVVPSDWKIDVDPVDMV